MKPDTHVAFVSGSVGELLPQIDALLSGNERARMVLFCASRLTSEVGCLEELQALKDRYLDRLALHFLFSEEPQEVEIYNGSLDAAKVRELAGTLFKPQQVDEYWISGPDGVPAALKSVLLDLGVGENQIRIKNRETADAQAAAASAEQEAEGTETRVTLTMDGRQRSFVMDRASGDTVLEAAEKAGLTLPYSCRAGVCSTCRTKVVRGKVEMAQNYALEPWELEAGYVLCCQSHPLTAELELDYDDQ